MTKATDPNTSISFSIEKMEPNGRGVSREGKVGFIANSLPNESGKAKLIFENNKRREAYLTSAEELTQTSPQRIKPDCSHFFECPGCQYLHVDYTDEWEFKIAGFQQQLKKFQLSSGELTHSLAHKRFEYRNRVQLHYCASTRRLGYKTYGGKEILKISDCLLPSDHLRSFVKQHLLTENFWSREEIQTQPQGHVEISTDKQNNVQMAFNQPYAHEGFSQVNTQMNQVLVQKVQAFATKASPLTNVLDLFGGNGNLSRELQAENTFVADSHLHHLPDNLRGIECNLYDSHALDIVCSAMGKRPLDLLLLDPPRSGLKNLSRWVETLNPRFLLYISCYPETLMRDIQKLPGKPSHWHLVDLYPGTKHLEVMAWIPLN